MSLHNCSACGVSRIWEGSTGHSRVQSSWTRVRQTLFLDVVDW